MHAANTYRFVSRAARTATLVLAVCGLIFPQIAHARRHPRGTAYHVIKSVNEQAKTVTVGTEHNKDETEQVLKVTGFTEITLDGQKATLHDLQPGMKVDIDLESDNEVKALDAVHVSKK